MATMKAALGGIPVRRATMTDFRTLRPGYSLQRAIELILAAPATRFPGGGRFGGALLMLHRQL